MLGTREGTPGAVMIESAPSVTDERPLSRRELLGGRGVSRGRGGLLGLGALAGFWAALGPMREALAEPPTPPTLARDLDPRALIVRLVQRTTFGPTPADLEKAASLGYEGWLDSQFKSTSDGLGSKLKPYDLLKMTAPKIYALKRANFDNEHESRQQLIRASIVRAAFSQRQLLERLVEFWGDHFNVVCEDDKRILKLVDDREVIRRHALGKFPAMLIASAQSPAMMRYLNNDDSTGDNPNENYAREIMELHTLGVTGPYTQQDINQVAKCLTGWGWFRPWDDRERLRGTFRFNPDDHNTEDKIVLGHSIPGQSGPAAIAEGMKVLQILGEHPSTARFIATKLCRKFLGDPLQTSWVDAAAAEYTRTGGDIKAMLRVILQPAFLAQAPMRLKRPFHLFVSAVRALGARLIGNGEEGAEELQWQLSNAGQEPFSWHPPNGYPDAAPYWANNPLPRWNFAASLPWGDLKGLRVDVPDVFGVITTAAQGVAALNTRLFQGLLPLAQGQALEAYLAGDPQSPDRQAETVGLALSAPAFQWY